jgi:hypothetical protein
MYNPTISSEIDAQQWFTSETCWFNLWKEPWCPLTEGWLGSRDSLVDLERKLLYLLGLELGWMVCLLIGWSDSWMGQLVVWLIGGLVGW